VTRFFSDFSPTTIEVNFTLFNLANSSFFARETTKSANYFSD
jgi:hypothetical protein